MLTGEEAYTPLLKVALKRQHNMATTLGNLVNHNLFKLQWVIPTTILNSHIIRKHSRLF